MTTNKTKPKTKQKTKQNSNNKDLIKEYLLDAKLQGLTDRTLETYKSNLKYFASFLDEKLTNASRKDLKNFLHHLKNEKKGRKTNKDNKTSYNQEQGGVTYSTINSYFSAINSFYKYLKYENRIEENPVPQFRDRYIHKNKQSNSKTKRQLISVEEMASLILSTLNLRNKAIITLLAKTGIRRNELIQIDLQDIDFEEQLIKLKPSKKRSNNIVFFDDETTRILKKWVKTRNKQEPETDALFTNQYGNRLKRHGIYRAVTKQAEEIGLHNPDSNDSEERFTPHCCRHWFTTHLRRSGMPREYIKELRGDKRSQTIDIYDHIDRKELKQSYQAHIPTLGI